MAKKTPIINDFRAGELTPDMDTRVEIKEYYKGCKTLEGCLPIIEGGIARMPGTVYVNPIKQLEEGWNIKVTKSGSGTGTVTSDVPGINCGASCYNFFPAGTTVVLTATPDGVNIFGGWSGEGFSGTNPISVLMNGNKVINASFLAKPPAFCQLSFYPLGSCIDGNYLYVVGQYTSGTTRKQMVARINITTMVVEEEVGYSLNTVSNGYDQFRGVCVDDTYAYLAGGHYDSGANIYYFSVRKVRKFNLSIESWHTLFYAPETANQTKFLTDIKVEGDAVYTVGNGASGNAFAHYISNGAQKWGLGGIYSNYQGVLMVPTDTPAYTNHVDNFGSAGGYLMLHRRLRSNGALAATIVYSSMYQFYLGCPGIGSYANKRYLASNNWNSVTNDWSVILYDQFNNDPNNIGNMWNKNIRPAGGYNYEYGIKPATDGTNVYIFGLYYNGNSGDARSFLAGVVIGGAELFYIADLWGFNVRGYGVCEVSSAPVYGGIFVANSNGVVERRKIIDGSLDTP